MKKIEILIILLIVLLSSCNKENVIGINDYVNEFDNILTDLTNEFINDQITTEEFNINYQKALKELGQHLQELNGDYTNDCISTYDFAIYQLNDFYWGYIDDKNEAISYLADEKEILLELLQCIRK